MHRALRAAPAALLVLSLVTIALTPRGGSTVPLFAARTGLQCGTCHFDPNGGGPRNEFGFTFAKNRHHIEAEPEGSEWKDLTLTNRVGENFPLYFGVNQRFMLFGNKLAKDEGTDRVGFYNMENSLHLAFQPHPRLTLVYSRDGFNQASSSKDAWGMISGGPANLYLKAGQFRVPFGLRMDDHTVATRNSFLDFWSPGGRFLPYDPRAMDQGLEVGAESNGVFARASLTNGGNNPFSAPNNHSQAASGKLGWNHPRYQGALSVYDDLRLENDFTSGRDEGLRSSRWSYYGMTHAGPVSLLGEVSAGTDEVLTSDPLNPVGKVNRLAYFAQLDWSPARPWSFRVRYDHLELDRSTDDAVRDAASWNRWALEGEWVPVPFAEIRWTARVIDPVADRDAFDQELESETQGYLQFHFSY